MLFQRRRFLLRSGNAIRVVIFKRRTFSNIENSHIYHKDRAARAIKILMALKKGTYTSYALSIAHFLRSSRKQACVFYMRIRSDFVRIFQKRRTTAMTYRRVVNNFLIFFNICFHRACLWLSAAILSGLWQFSAIVFDFIRLAVKNATASAVLTAHQA